MTSVWIVHGWCWESHSCWHVAAYTSKEQADGHAKRLEAAVKAMNHRRAGREKMSEGRRLLGELDWFVVKYDILLFHQNLCYGAKEVKLFRHQDEYLENR